VGVYLRDEKIGSYFIVENVMLAFIIWAKIEMENPA